ncbi:MAG: hypothetical protein WDO71_04965 [Bacteroidota bacterium]
MKIILVLFITKITLCPASINNMEEYRVADPKQPGTLLSTGLEENAKNKHTTIISLLPSLFSYSLFSGL